MTLLLVLVGGAVGAPARYLTDRALQRRTASVFPWGTLFLNVVGSLVLGGVAAAAYAGSAPSWVLTFVGTGFCGALTTFSTFGYETVRLLEDGARWEALGNAVLSLVVGMLACAAGWWGVSALL